MLYHPNTLRQICYLRGYLLRKKSTYWSREEFMIAGSLAGIMHGSFRRDGTSQYLSISMPNTFSMSPEYVRKYIQTNHLEPPTQDVFECLRNKFARLYLDSIEGPDGRAFMQDGPSLLTRGSFKRSCVDLVITSPPYLQVVNYGTANWIRLWLLGLDEVGRERGAGRRALDEKLDHRHTYTSYRAFLLRTLRGIQRVLKQDGIAVLVIGDVADPGKDPIPLAAQIWQDIGNQTNLHQLELIADYLVVENKVSRIWGDTKGQATSRDCALVLARNDGCPPSVPEIIDWDEPYKDGGPDAAHARMREIRLVP
jgi:site-specific DNA-methyltransferase (adenine-specific)